jgi:hypothetical protein
VAQDVEPEYIAISEDSTTAWVALQENNALAVLDINSGQITDILPLGFKDYNASGNGLDASNRDDEINIQNLPVLGCISPMRSQPLKPTAKPSLSQRTKGTAVTTMLSAKKHK